MVTGERTWINLIADSFGDEHPHEATIHAAHENVWHKQTGRYCSAESEACDTCELCLRRDCCITCEQEHDYKE